jgi:hypothetical protein
MHNSLLYLRSLAKPLLSPVASLPPNRRITPTKPFQRSRAPVTSLRQTAFFTHRINHLQRSPVSHPVIPINPSVKHEESHRKRTDPHWHFLKVLMQCDRSLPGSVIGRDLRNGYGHASQLVIFQTSKGVIERAAIFRSRDDSPRYSEHRRGRLYRIADSRFDSPARGGRQTLPGVVFQQDRNALINSVRRT